MSVIYVPTGEHGIPARGIRRSSSPSVSVVVASTHDRLQLEKGLDYLVPVALGSGAEVLVARADAPARLADLARTYTGVRFIVAPPGAARNDLMALGMAESSGHVVALTDDGRLLAEDWHEVLAHRAGVLRPGPGLTKHGRPVDWLSHLKASGAVEPPPPGPWTGSAR